MPTDVFSFMVIAFAAGLGLALVGALNVLLRSRSTATRASLSLAILVAMCGATFALTDTSSAVLKVAGILGLATLAVYLAGSDWLASAVQVLSNVVRNPFARWGTVGICGLAVAVGAVTYSDNEFMRDVDRDTAQLEMLGSPPPSVAPVTRAVTDLGRDVAIRETTEYRSDSHLQSLEDAIFNQSPFRESVIRCQPGSDRTNCHGWVFTGGRYWISGEEVDRILTENGYRTQKQPQPGDLVIYRSNDRVMHTAIVRYVTEGLPVLVEGKWGCSSVFLHPVEKSVYGSQFQYYRSSRSGHVLAGLQSTDPALAQGSPIVIPDPARPDEFTE